LIRRRRRRFDLPGGSRRLPVFGCPSAAGDRREGFVSSSAPGMRRKGLRIMNKLANLVDSIYAKLNFFAGLSLIVMIAVTLSDVVFRATGLHNGSLRGAMEINICMMAILVFLSFGKCTTDDGFIRVEIFKFGRAEKPIRRLIDVLHAAICLIVAWNCILQGISAQNMHGVSQLLKIPKYPFVYLSAVAFLLVAIGIPAYNIRVRARCRSEAGDAEAAEGGGVP
jgi:TRAP-type C4-dicarboxylate transport system permease small subunit